MPFPVRCDASRYSANSPTSFCIQAFVPFEETPWLQLLRLKGYRRASVTLTGYYKGVCFQGLSPNSRVLPILAKQLYSCYEPNSLIQLLSNIILSRLSSAPTGEAVYIDTLGTYNPSLLESLLPRHSTDGAILSRIRLMPAFDMISLIEACENIKQSLSQLVPIELLVIDTIANPLSLLMNKGQLQGTMPASKLT
jgi:hypothetical protein